VGGKGLVIATGLFCVLAGLIFWSNKHKAAEEAKPPASTTPQVLHLNQADVTGISIAKKGGAAVVLQKTGNDWRLTEPKSYPVDTDSVTSFLQSVSSVDADSVVEDRPADIAQFGLAQPSVTVTLTMKDGKTRTLLIGDDAPTGGDVYAKTENSPKVYALASYTKTSLDKGVNDFRDKRLLTFNQDKLTSVELDTQGQQIEFAKNNQNDWQIVKPKPMRADGLQVEELVRKLKDAKMDLSASADDLKKADAAYASGTPVGTAKVTDANGTQELTVRKKDNDYYAKSSAVEGAYKVTSELGEGLAKSLDDFRNKKLFDFAYTDPNKIEMQDGAKHYLFTRTGEDWFQNGKKMDPISVQSFIDKLRDLSAAKFVDTGTAPAATITITVVSNDNKRSEKVNIGKSGDNWLASREGEPTIYQLDAKAVQDLQTAAGDVKPATAAKKK